MSWREVGMRRIRVLGAVLGAGLLVAVAGCGAGSGRAGGVGSGGSQAAAAPLVVYNGQHASTTKILVGEFTKATGIPVKVNSASDGELANQIVSEGSRSPADVVYTENSPALMLLSDKGKLAKTKPATRGDVPARYDSPRHDWMGVAGRETVLVYDPQKIPESQLPHSIMDLGKASWPTKVGIQPSRPDFQAIVGGIAALEGPQKTEGWLKGLNRHAASFNHAEGILTAVNRGEIPVGIVYNYDYFRARAESPSSVAHTRLYYFGHHDPGALLSISGAGVLHSSKHKTEARRFITFLTSRKGQTDLAESDDFEYPLNPTVSPNPALKPFDQLHTPKVSPGQIGDGHQAVTLLQQAGML
jgi:iron(III) transport system substrate-binding protein